MESTPNQGQWDTLFAFRDAALHNDTGRMAQIVAADDTFIAHENPDDLPYDYLAKTYQIQTFSREGPIEKVRELLEQIPRLVQQPWTEQCWLPLSQAVWGGRLEIVCLLLERGAEVNATVDEGLSILELARGQSNQAIINLLLSHGAK